MRRVVRFLPLACLLLGLLLLADAIAQGGATLTLFLIIPVLSGSSWEFFAGSALVVLGMVGWFAVGSVELSDAPTGSSAAPASRTRSGGVVLIGPIPIFFGDGRPTTRAGRWAWGAVGAILTILFVVAVLVYALRT